MGILELLGFAGPTSRETRKAASHSEADTDTVRRIVGELDKMEAGRARFLAAFAYVLSRAAAADMHISEDETNAMVEILQRVGHLPEEQAVLAVAIAKSQNRLFGGTEDYLVTREFREISTEEQRLDLLNCLFAVTASDDTITAEEEALVRQIARELGFGHEQFVKARLAFADKRSVLKIAPPRRRT